MELDLTMSLLERCPRFQRTGFNRVGPEYMSLLERCPHFRGCCVQQLSPPLTGPTQLISTEAFEHIFSSEASSDMSAAITSIPSIPDATQGKEERREGGGRGESKLVTV